MQFALTSSSLWSFTKNLLCTSHIMQVYLTLRFFAKHIVIFKILMDNWRIGLANLEQMIQLGNGRTNRMIEEK